MFQSFHSLRYLTHDLPGVGGVIKRSPDDFLVDEQPLYEPCGEGEHLYLFIEKRSLTTSDLVRRVAQACRVSKRDVGYAGLKDKHAVTRQLLSVYLPNKSDDAAVIERVQSKVNLLWVDRHTNKLRRGHHAGNRFVIYIREVEATLVLRARAILERLAVSGVPNYVGDQRFGYRQDNARLGAMLLKRQWEPFLKLMLGEPRDLDFETTRLGREAFERGDYAEALRCWPKHHRPERQALDMLRQGKAAEQAVRHVDRMQLDFLLSALQSGIFNAVLDRRLETGTFDRLLAGDLAWKHDNDSIFAVDAATAELENAPTGRVPGLEVSPSGPNWGADMPQATGVPGDIERQGLLDAGLTEAELNDATELAPTGRRRSLRMILRDPDLSGGVDEQGGFIRLAFTLPPGAYATVVLREVMKDEGRTALPQVHPRDEEQDADQTDQETTS